MGKHYKKNMCRKGRKKRMISNEKKGRASALLPILVFLLLYVGSGIYYQYIRGEDQGFYIMSVVVAFTAALTVALLQNRELDFNEKLKVMAEGVGDDNIIAMILIFLFAGAFSGMAAAAGGSSGTAYLLLDILPANQLLVGFFIIACVISMAMGTSCGTISVLVPIAAAAAEAAGMNLAVMLGAIIGGAMFGDNMSFISDTTIAATRTQGCDMKDKFRENFAIALPAAVVTIVILLFRGGSGAPVENPDYNILQALPYFIVFALALAGLNVLVVLGSGILLFTVVGFITIDGFTFSDVFGSMGEGTSGMFETIIVAVLVSALGALIKKYGGFDYILYVIRRYFRGKNGGQLGIAVLSSAMDIATANNTVAIVMAAPIAKEISSEYKISPKKTASLMDIFCCIWQGIIPYGAQMLIALGLAAEYKLSAFDVIPNIHYVFLLLICALVSIFLPERVRKRS